MQVLGGRAHRQGRGVHQLLGDEPRIGVGAFAHRVMAHVLDAASDGHVVRAERNPAGERRHRGHGARAHPVDRVTRHAAGKSGEDRRDPAQGESLVADLGGGRDRHVVDALRWQVRVAAEQLANHGDDHVVRPGLGVQAVLAGPAERGPNAVDENDIAQRAGFRCAHWVLLGRSYSPVT